MLDPQIVVNLFLELGVSVDLVIHGNWLSKSSSLIKPIWRGLYSRKVILSCVGPISASQPTWARNPFFKGMESGRGES